MNEIIIINNLDDEVYVGDNLHEYKLTFENANTEQQSFIEAVFDDWSWGMGLNIAHLKKVQENSLVIYIFQSPISFVDKDIQDWADEDIESNILTKLVGKEQFFSQFLFSECNVETLNILFHDPNENKYNVEVSKYSSMISI
jgi:hypothetical protein